VIPLQGKKNSALFFPSNKDTLHPSVFFFCIAHTTIVLSKLALSQTGLKKEGILMQVQTHIAKGKNDYCEQSLMASARQGDARAFESIVRHYTPPLYNFIYRFVGNQEQANDILQDVMIRFYKSLPSLYYDKPLASWLYQVAHHCCIDELRKKYRTTVYFSQLKVTNEYGEEFYPNEIHTPVASAEEEFERKDLQEYIQHAITALPTKYRAIVVLRYASNLPFSAIGNIIGIPQATAKTYFCRAKKLLRTMIEREEVR
jgi:RNA polymerase sigma factor (sigma-70 family)